MEIHESVFLSYDAGFLTPEDVDDRAIEMLRSFPVNEAVFLIKELEVFYCDDFSKFAIVSAFATVRCAEQATVSDVGNA